MFIISLRKYNECLWLSSFIHQATKALFSAKPWLLPLALLFLQPHSCEQGSSSWSSLTAVQLTPCLFSPFLSQCWFVPLGFSLESVSGSVFTSHAWGKLPIPFSVVSLLGRDFSALRVWVPSLGTFLSLPMRGFHFKRISATSSF